MIALPLSKCVEVSGLCVQCCKSAHPIFMMDVPRLQFIVGLGLQVLIAIFLELMFIKEKCLILCKSRLWRLCFKCGV